MKKFVYVPFPDPRDPGREVIRDILNGTIPDPIDLIDELEKLLDIIVEL